MTKQQEENFAIAKAIIINQICIEANEELRDYPRIYRFSLKHHANKTIEELEKRIPECDDAFKVAEEFYTYTTQRIEMIIPMIAKLRTDELTNIVDFIEAYKIDPDKTRKFLSETLNKELL
jgi:hypothetical protein